MVRKWLILFLFTAFLAGGFLQLEERFQLLRLRSVDIKPQGILPNRVVWNRITKSEKRFWPLLLIQRRELAENIMESVPARVFMGISGWGRFTMKVTPLTPWFMVFWNGSEWYLSLDGRIWSVHHTMNSVTLHQEPQEGPILVWTESMYDLVSTPSHKMTFDSVMMSKAPVENLKTWKTRLQDLGFYGLTDSITVLQNDGKLYLELLVRRAPQTIRVLVPASSGEWGHIFPAVREILEQARAVGRDLFIDATYSGKILVRTETSR